MAVRVVGTFQRFRYKGDVTARYLADKKLFSYTCLPVRKIPQMEDIGRRAMACLDTLKELPTLLMAGLREETVSLKKMQSAAKSRPWIRFVELPSSEHILTVEPDHDRVFAECLTFMSDALNISSRTC
jgi:alpha-beta hydrolase superfamily lysophospholipase